MHASRDLIAECAKGNDWEKKRSQFPLQDCYERNGLWFDLRFDIMGRCISGHLSRKSNWEHVAYCNNRQAVLELMRE